MPPMLAGGLWIVRLRAPFDRSRFVSAASTALREVARAELDDAVPRRRRPGRHDKLRAWPAAARLLIAAVRAIACC